MPSLPSVRGGPRLGMAYIDPVRRSAAQSELEPEELSTLPPRALSFWLGSLFQDSQLTQLALLEVGCR